MRYVMMYRKYTTPLCCWVMYVLQSVTYYTPNSRHFHLSQTSLKAVCPVSNLVCYRDISGSTDCVKGATGIMPFAHSRAALQQGKNNPECVTVIPIFISNQNT